MASPILVIYAVETLRTRRDFHSIAASSNFPPLICDPTMAILSEAETEVCERNPFGDGFNGFLDEFDPKFKSFNLSDFKALLRSDEGKFARPFMVRFG